MTDYLHEPHEPLSDCDCGDCARVERDRLSAELAKHQGHPVERCGGLSDAASHGSASRDAVAKVTTPLLGRAADMLTAYAELIRRDGATRVEEHHYLPEVEWVASELRAASLHDASDADDFTLIAFEAWWQRHGQFCRAGGGDYVKTFAWRAWAAALEIPCECEARGMEARSCEASSPSSGASVGSHEAQPNAQETHAVQRWIPVSERLPKQGELIVKRWRRTGSVWAGVFAGTAKDSSFDEWFALPPSDASEGPSGSGT